jgi:hypothetical protein
LALPLGRRTGSLVGLGVANADVVAVFVGFTFEVDAEQPVSASAPARASAVEITRFFIALLS